MKTPRHIALVSSGLLIMATLAAPARDLLVFFGTHNVGPDRGFSIAHFNTDTGALTVPKFDVAAPAPAFFILSADGKYLYACNSGNANTVSAYAVDPQTGHLTLLNKQSTTDGTGNASMDSSYVSLDKTGHYLLDANYNGGSIAVFALNPNGSLGNRTAFVQHTGRSLNPQRQSHPYAHSIITDPSNRFALVADLGLDKVFVYKFDEKAGTLTPNDPPFVETKAGTGPRHLVFHPNGQYVYLISEMGSLVTLFAWDGDKGTLKELQSISTLPADFKGANADSEIALHPNGKFLYAANRGLDALTVFSIAPATGWLAVVDRTSTEGKTPRNFTFDPTGQWILASNQDSDTVIVFRVDAQTGKLTKTGNLVPIKYPFCERFLVLPENQSSATAAGAPHTSR